MSGSEETEQIAVYGGSFDPPHIAHVLTVAWVLSATTVDRVLVVPTFRHPLGKTPGAAYGDRVALCELAMADLRRVEVSRIEEELDGTGRTLDLLEALRHRFAGAGLRLVVGTDILRQTHRWHQWDRVTRLAPPIVVGRGGFSDGHGGPLMPAVSSTEIRARLADGTSTEGLLPTRVKEYVRAHGLYRSPAT